MDRFVLVARLKPGAREQAEAFLADGLALDTKELDTAFERHVIFLSESEAIFLFEGDGTSEAVRAVFNDPVKSSLIGHWLQLFDGPLHRAAEAYLWERREP